MTSIREKEVRLKLKLVEIQNSIVVVMKEHRGETWVQKYLGPYTMPSPDKWANFCHAHNLPRNSFIDYLPDYLTCKDGIKCGCEDLIESYSGKTKIEFKKKTKNQ